ncbi:MAG: hypothetical protein IJI05_06320, partial [Erysipelotrichaceae bacterium]|nr:hypothetical protein [Erysipelotrichaceae bacterium]
DYSGYGSMDLEQEVFDYETWDYIVKQVFGDEDYVYTVDEISCYFDIEDDKITYYHYIIDLTKVGTSETGDYSFSCSNYDDREVYYSEYEWNVAEKVDDIDEIAVPLLENNVKH